MLRAMSRTRFADLNCGIAQALEALGDWWTLLIVRDAFFGARRFGAFEANLGIAKNVLDEPAGAARRPRHLPEGRRRRGGPALRVPPDREGRGAAAAAHRAARLVGRMGLRPRPRAGDREGPAHAAAHPEAAGHRRRRQPAHAPRPAQRARPGCFEPDAAAARAPSALKRKGLSRAAQSTCSAVRTSSASSTNEPSENTPKRIGMTLRVACTKEWTTRRAT